MIIYESEASFSMWDFAIGLKVLLLRNNTLQHDMFKNVDIIFVGVFYLNIPTHLVGISIFELSEDDYHKNDILYSKKHVSEKFFVIKSGEREYIIGALGFSVYYTNLEYNRSSIRQDVKEKLFIAGSND